MTREEVLAIVRKDQQAIFASRADECRFMGRHLSDFEHAEQIEILLWFLQNEQKSNAYLFRSLEMMREARTAWERRHGKDGAPAR